MGPRDLPVAWLLAPAAAGLVVPWITGRLVLRDAPPVQLSPTAAEVGDTQRVAWTGRAGNPHAGAVALLAAIAWWGRHWERVGRLHQVGRRSWCPPWSSMP